MLTEVTLACFTGAEIKFKHWLGKIEYTEGIKFLADKAQAYWLIDAIVSYQSKSLLQQYPELTEFQLWQLEVNEDKTAVLTCRADSGCEPIIVQHIELTTFPLQSIKFYLCHQVLMLTSEY